MSVLALPSGFGYVALATVATWVVHHGVMSIGVMQARKKYGVKFPTLYATEADCKDETSRKTYNCVQRGHQNSLENLPSFYALLLTAGLKYPITASVAAAFYLVGRVFYFQGYASGNPEKRMNGSFMYIGIFTLLGTSIKIAIDLLSQ
mmetsp:Transcript_8683/g.14999  ORF Transcript_8683/g.14999 Transcript_8683/m.14999 type:complete len:148 (+) Transcript_8683:93-536(+)|eukprot:CAMPEP_0119107480 /NCGR_PEP_ID=MMETSP1180-20130426/10449_1 /TAXON_ID=3052 ORGANISM="Chlamydomonas cf sp, Strain CCMP681" /NCGR_SAMPLE_ID=MMETSP1180 /ASSEMBLY_ACC=CAM_ASM_000741 /LENGTH=147 /DNA_ID=CAMNT_0007092975 /DNA_START=93 /DNA_END=536 /DNA_ORIENTATION=+